MLPFAGFISPYTPNERSAEYLYAPPQSINLWHEGSFVGPYVYPITGTADLEEFRWRYRTDTSTPMPLEFLCEGDVYNLFGFIPSDTHLFCAPEGATVFLWGSDRLGRDVFSRIMFGAQLSLTVGLIGITVSFLLGITFGSIAGYFGGKTDWTINRLSSRFCAPCQSCPSGWLCPPPCPQAGGPSSVFFIISVISGHSGLARSGARRAVQIPLLARGRIRARR